MNTSSTMNDAHPLSGFGITMLARGAARLRPERPAIKDANAGSEALTFADLDQRASALGAELVNAGLQSDDRIAIAAAATTGSLIAILGTLGAGHSISLVPPHLDADALAAHARSHATRALLGPSTVFNAHEALDLERVMFEAAMQAPEIRLVGSLGTRTGETPGDGALDLSPSALAQDSPSGAALAQNAAHALPMLAFAGNSCAPIMRTQDSLIQDALSIIAAADYSAARPIISLVSLATPAGLAAGPLAAMLCGAELTLMSLFDADVLIGLLEKRGPFTLVAPAAIADDLYEADLLGNRCIEGLVLTGGNADIADWQSETECRVLRILSNESGALRLFTGDEERDERSRDTARRA